MSESNRRDFLKTTAATSAAMGLSYVPTFVHAGGVNGTLKVGLIGCGGRGSGAARQALLADPDVKLWAVGDAFQNRVNEALNSFRRTNGGIREFMDVPESRQFVGLNAYQEVIANCIVTMVGGLETTTNLIGNGILSLLRNPDQLARLRAEPELMPAAVEELLRYESPSQHTGRLAPDDVVLGGQTNKAAAWYYPEPFPAARNIAGYIAFWKGVKVVP